MCTDLGAKGPRASSSPPRLSLVERGLAAPGSDTPSFKTARSSPLLAQHNSSLVAASHSSSCCTCEHRRKAHGIRGRPQGQRGRITLGLGHFARTPEIPFPHARFRASRLRLACQRRITLLSLSSRSVEPPSRVPRCSRNQRAERSRAAWLLHRSQSAASGAAAGASGV